MSIAILTGLCGGHAILNSKGEAVTISYIRKIDDKHFGLTVAHPWEKKGDIVYAAEGDVLKPAEKKRIGQVYIIDQDMDACFFVIDDDVKCLPLTVHAVGEVEGSIAPVTSAYVLAHGYGALTRGASGQCLEYKSPYADETAAEKKEKRATNYATVVCNTGKDEQLTAGGDCGAIWFSESGGEALAMHCMRQTVTVPLLGQSSSKQYHRHIGPRLEIVRSLFPEFFPIVHARAPAVVVETKKQTSSTLDSDEIFRSLCRVPGARVTESRLLCQFGEEQSLPAHDILTTDEIFLALATIKGSVVTESRD